MPLSVALVDGGLGVGADRLEGYPAGCGHRDEPGREHLEAVSADTESAINECNLEAQRWILETDQAFAMAALPLARGLA